MIKETITYTDYNGTERTEDFYFNMTKTELLRMEQDKSGSFSGVLEKFIKAKDNADLSTLSRSLSSRHMARRAQMVDSSRSPRRFLSLSSSPLHTRCFSIS